MTESRYIPSSLSNDFHTAHPDRDVHPAARGRSCRAALPVAGAHLHHQVSARTPGALGTEMLPAPPCTAGRLEDGLSITPGLPRGSPALLARRVGPEEGCDLPAPGGCNMPALGECDPPAPEGCDPSASEGCDPPLSIWFSIHGTCASSSGQ